MSSSETILKFCIGAWNWTLISITCLYTSTPPMHLHDVVLN